MASGPTDRTSVIDLAVQLDRREWPFTYFTAGGLLSPETLRRLNAELPARELFSREIKEGTQHRKQYNMWRMGVFEDGARLPVVERLPTAWSQLLDDVLSAAFRTWLLDQTGVRVQDLPLTAGFYLFSDRDYTTVDTGKATKALSMAIYLAQDWRPGYGGAFQAWTAKDAAEPVARVLPQGGHCVARLYSPTSWHNVGSVDTGGRRERMTLQLEYWQA